MALSCARAGRLSLRALADQATMAERLELEAHLAGCARCGADHAALADVRRLRQVEPDELGAAARARLHAAVFARPARAESEARPLRRLFWPFAAGAALAVAAGIALWVPARHDPGPRVLGGDVISEQLVTPDGPEAALALRSAQSGEVQLGAARASLARATEIVWRRERRRVDLRAGSVTFDVEHRAGQSFEVWTPRFVVDVVGTRFSVDLGGVRTERGTVRVLSTDGKLIAYVEAGRSWSLPAASAAAALAEGPPPPAAPPAALPAVKAPPEAEAPPAVKASPEAGAPPAVKASPEAEAPPAVARSPLAGASDGAVARSPLAGAGDGAVARSPLAGAGDGAAARLASARAALARGDAAEARRTLEPVLRVGREVAAEARALYAESFLVEGRYTDAEASYRTLIRDFPRTAQAESALYATAQLASEHGRIAEARDAVARYLDRYPRGRFAKEAAELQARLTLPR